MVPYYHVSTVHVAILSLVYSKALLCSIKSEIANLHKTIKFQSRFGSKVGQIRSGGPSGGFKDDFSRSGGA